MATTYEPIATTTVSGTVSSIVFSSIPNTYTDLRIVFNGAVSASTALRVQLNSDTGSNYYMGILYGDGSAASGNGFNNSFFGPTWARGLDTTIPTFVTLDILSYAGSTYKPILSKEAADRNGTGSVSFNNGLWKSTSAVTRVELYISGGSYNNGTTATIYGIKAA